MPRLITTPLTFFLRNHDVLVEKMIDKYGVKTRYPREYPKQKDWQDQKDYYVFSVTYSKPFNPNWTNSELLDAIIKLNCHGNYYVKLESLPDLPNCRSLECASNALTSLPRLDVCISLYCPYNELTSLVSLPKCQFLDCWGNKIQEIGWLPECRMLRYNNDPMTFICPLPQVHTIVAGASRENLLSYWKKQWAYRERKYFRLWYLAMLKYKAIRRQALHEEMRFSPDTLIENEYTLAKRSFESKQK